MIYFYLFLDFGGRLLYPYLPKVGSKGSIATEGKILQNRGDFEFEASALAHCCAWQEFQKFSFYNNNNNNIQVLQNSRIS